MPSLRRRRNQKKGRRGGGQGLRARLNSIPRVLLAYRRFRKETQRSGNMNELAFLVAAFVFVRSILQGRGEQRREQECEAVSLRELLGG